jgi:hypothetical protein
MTGRTRAARRLRRQGFTHELVSWAKPLPGVPRVMIIFNAGHDQDAVPAFGDQVIRPVGTAYIHNGRKRRK